MTAVKKPSLKKSPRKKRLHTVTFVTILLGIASVLSPLIPMIVVTPGNRRVLFNMMGVVNQEVGSDLTRDDAFPLLIIYVVAIVVMAVGFVNAYEKLKSAPYYIMASAAMLIVFSFVWMNMDNPSRDAARASLSESFLPYLMLIMSVGALASSLLWLLGDAGKSNIPERKNTHSQKRKK